MRQQLLIIAFGQIVLIQHWFMCCYQSPKGFFALLTVIAKN